MTKNELIEFGLKLVDKGRNPREVMGALSLKISDKDLLNEVYSLVYDSETKQETPKKNPEVIRELLKANRIKLSFEYSQKGLLKIPLLLMAVAGIIFVLSNEVVNQNGIFAWTTLVQSVFLLVLFALVKYKGMMQMLLFALVGYCLIAGIEVISFGIPNDLLQVYYEQNIHLNAPTGKLQMQSGAARLIGFMFPYMYVGVKVFFAVLLYTVYNRHRKYDALTFEVKEDLKTL